jgi:hypothetical protein
VTSYKVQYSLDGVHFEELPDEFAANTDVSTKVTNTLTDSIVARYVRVLPYGTDGSHLMMRAAVVIDDVAACWTCLGTSPPPPVVELHGRSGVSVALGQNAAGSGAGLWDGDHSSQYGWQAAVYSNQLSTCAESMVATVDLGEVYMTTGATLWRFYYQTTSRAYCNQKLAVSASGEFAGEETVVYEIPGCSGWCTDPTACTNAEAGDCTAANYGGFETADGTVLEWDATPARYIRQWSGRNNENTGSHLSEMTIAGYLSGSSPDENGVVDVPELYRSYSNVHGGDAPGTGHAQSTLDSSQAWNTGQVSIVPGNEWVEMDLGRARYVNGVVTQGRADFDQWTTSYKVQHSWDGVSFEEHAEQCTGNSDRATKVAS